MKTYGRVVANQLWTTVNGKVEKVAHNSVVEIKEERYVEGHGDMLLCYFPYLNDDYWVRKDTIEVKRY
jgi:hypothetical protein